MGLREGCKLYGLMRHHGRHYLSVTKLLLPLSLWNLISSTWAVITNWSGMASSLSSWAKRQVASKDGIDIKWAKPLNLGVLWSHSILEREGHSPCRNCWTWLHQEMESCHLCLFPGSLGGHSCHSRYPLQSRINASTMSLHHWRQPNGCLMGYTQVTLLQAAACILAASF